MGILGNLFGMDDERSSDIGARIALAGQALMAMDQGQVPNIAPSIAALNERRRKIADEMKTTKWMQNQAAAMADKNPRLAAMLQDAPPGVGESLINKYLETQFAPPDWKTFESQGDVYRYNQNDPNSKPELFYDGPEDPFKALIKSITLPGQVQADKPDVLPNPAPSTTADPTVPQSSSSSTPATGEPLTPQMKQLARMFGLPPNVTADDVRSLADAAAAGEDNARATAAAIRDRYKDADSRSFEVTNKQVENAFELGNSYWKTGGETYAKIINNANEVAAIIPEDANGFERLASLYKFMRGLDPAGAVRESDAAMAQNADSIISKADQIIQKYSGVSGGDVPLTAAIEMKRLILELGETASKADYKARKQTIKRAVAAGIPADKAENLIFGSLQEDPADMEGYVPRFTPGPRKSDTEMATGSDATSLPAQAPAGAPQVKTIADYNKLEPGTVYIDPNGLVKTKGGTK